MSEQIPDPFFWNDEEWVFLEADDVYSLFDPEKFGLSPSMDSTACYKGFVIQFKIIDNVLIFDKLSVYCENNIYPTINGIEAKPSKEEWTSMKVYENINLKLNYSGTIIIGKNMESRFHGRAFTGPYSYETTFELKFKKGQLVSSKETSGSYFGF